MATGYAKESRYQQLLNAVTNPAKFTYDAAEDPAFSALKKMYLREGQRASENALAQAAAATGGRPSSYALTAAQQAGDNYAAKLTDAIPTLEQNAYQRYLSDLEAKQNALSVLNADRNAYLEQASSGTGAGTGSNAVTNLLTGIGGSAGSTLANAGEKALNWLQGLVGGKKDVEDNADTDAYASAKALLDSMIANRTAGGSQADINTVDGQRALRSAVLAEINDALAAGAITPAQAAELRKAYVPQGLTY